MLPGVWFVKHDLMGLLYCYTARMCIIHALSHLPILNSSEVRKVPKGSCICVLVGFVDIIMYIQVARRYYQGFAVLSFSEQVPEGQTLRSYNLLCGAKPLQNYYLYHTL
jgi:hypothetical protein